MTKRKARDPQKVSASPPDTTPAPSMSRTALQPANSPESMYTRDQASFILIDDEDEA